LLSYLYLKVVSVISGPKKKDHIQLIFPNDQLAALHTKTNGNNHHSKSK